MGGRHDDGRNKTFGGPKSAAIISKSAAHARLIDRTLFPGLQGAPRLAEIAGLATAAHVAQTAAYRKVIHDSIRLAKALTHALGETSLLRPAFGGTDTHMLLLKCRDAVSMAQYLERAGIFTNANMLPGDLRPSAATGIRLGTVAVTQRGLSSADAPDLARLLTDAVTDFYAGGGRAEDVRCAVRGFTRQRLKAW